MASIKQLKAFNFQNWIEENKENSSLQSETRRSGKTER